MNNETKFVNGLRIFKPHVNAPEFIKFSGLIHKKEMLEFLKNIPKEEIRFDCKESKSGTFYTQISTWKPS